MIENGNVLTGTLVLFFFTILSWTYIAGAYFATSDGDVHFLVFGLVVYPMFILFLLYFISLADTKLTKMAVETIRRDVLHTAGVFKDDQEPFEALQLLAWAGVFIVFPEKGQKVTRCTTG